MRAPASSTMRCWSTSAASKMIKMQSIREVLEFLTFFSRMKVGKMNQLHSYLPISLAQIMTLVGKSGMCNVVMCTCNFSIMRISMFCLFDVKTCLWPWSCCAHQSIFNFLQRNFEAEDVENYSKYIAQQLIDYEYVGEQQPLKIKFLGSRLDLKVKQKGYLNQMSVIVCKAFSILIK